MDTASINMFNIKCPQHTSESLDFIDLTGKFKEGRICQFCIQSNRIPFEEYIPISTLLQQNEGEILNFYPPFKNQQLWEYIQSYCQENISQENIDVFFRQLRKDIEEAIQVAENQAKKQLTKNLNSKQILVQQLIKMGEPNKLKELLDLGNCENLNMFLSEKWQNAESNQQIIQKVFNQIQENTQTLILSQKQKEVNCLIQSLSELTLFSQGKNIINNVKWIKSSLSSSGSLTINQTGRNSLQLFNDTEINQHGQAYLDFVIKSKKKYVITLNYQPKSNDSYFYFGLVSDNLKDSNWGQDQKMSYYNRNESYGISKYIKGPNITKGQRENVKEEFEVRISQDEKILKVASLPNYETIIELDDPKKIETQTEYRFYCYLYYEGDIIEITSIMESPLFENNIF